MAERMRFGIIGAGVIAEYHARAIEAQPDGLVVAVASRGKAKAEAFASRHSCEVVADWRDMIRRDDIESVCVCTPSGLHAGQSIAAASAGKHVMVEKPMALNIKDSVDMIRAARDHDVRLAVIYQLRTGESPGLIKKAIGDGVFGRIVFGDASLKYWRNQAYYDSADWRGTWAMDGGGSSMIQGSHGIDLLLYMMGDVKSIYARYGTVAHDIEVEDAAIALLTYKNGAYGRLETATATNPGTGNIFEINGTKGSVVMVENIITSWAVSDSSDVLAVETVHDVTGEAGAGTTSASEFPITGHIIQMGNFIAAIRKGDELICSGREGLKSVHLIMALYESSRRGEEVCLNELLEGCDL